MVERCKWCGYAGLEGGIGITNTSVFGTCRSQGNSCHFALSDLRSSERAGGISLEVVVPAARGSRVCVCVCVCVFLLHGAHGSPEFQE